MNFQLIFDTQLLLFMLVLFSLDGQDLKEEGIWVDLPKYVYFQAGIGGSQLGTRISCLWPAFLYIGASFDLLWKQHLAAVWSCAEDFSSSGVL